MSKSNLQIYLHIVFSTKNRRHSIYPEVEKALYPFIWKKIKELNCEPLAVNGMADHIHILLKFDGRIFHRCGFKSAPMENQHAIQHLWKRCVILNLWEMGALIHTYVKTNKKQ